MDKKKAVELYTKATHQQDALAENNLGVRFKYGKEVLMDNKKVVELFTKAADQGDASAQNNLGVCFSMRREF